MAEDRRRSFRRLLKRHAVVAAGGESFEAKTLDLSGEGLCLSTNKPLSPGVNLRVAFEVPAAGSAHRVRVAGKVSYCALAGVDGFRIGLEFTEIDAASAAAIAAFVK
jgi:hypothetical protein